MEPIGNLDILKRNFLAITETPNRHDAGKTAEIGGCCRAFNQVSVLWNQSYFRPYITNHQQVVKLCTDRPNINNNLFFLLYWNFSYGCLTHSIAIWKYHVKLQTDNQFCMRFNSIKIYRTFYISIDLCLRLVSSIYCGLIL